MSNHLELTILAFAQARDLLGFSEKKVFFREAQTPREILRQLGFTSSDLPQGTRVALDCQYSDWDIPLGSSRELAVLPPVSGG